MLCQDTGPGAALLNVSIYKQVKSRDESRDISKDQFGRWDQAPKGHVEEG